MADKAITDLTQATQITGDDLFVLEQNGEAKKLKGSQVVQYAKDSVAAEVQGVKEYADNAKASADAAAKDATRAETAAQGIDDKVSAADASAKAAAASAAAAASSAAGVDEKVQAAQTAADNAAKSETAAKNAQTAASNAQKAAETAQTGAQSAKTAAESAQEAAESAKDAAAGSATSAGQKATQAAQSAEDAASAKSAAETAKTDAQAARDAIVNMMVEAITLETGKPATVSKSLVDSVYKLVFGLPRGETGAQGPKGATGNGISGIALKSGNHAPGTSDVYTITLTDGTTFDFAVYNGANGQGAGDMLASIYDPQGKRTDVFKYVDDGLAKKQGVDDEIQAVRLRGGINSIVNNASAVSINPAVNAIGFLRYNGGNAQIFYDGVLMPFQDWEIDTLFDGKSSTYINFGVGPSNAKNEGVCRWNEATQYPKNARVMYQTASGVFRWYKALKESRGVTPEGDSTGAWTDISVPGSPYRMDVRNLDISIVIDSPSTFKYENGTSFYWRAAGQNCGYYKIEIYDSVQDQYVLVAERDGIPQNEVVNTQYLGANVNGDGKRARITLRAQPRNDGGWFAATQIALSGIKGGIEGTLLNRGGDTMYGDLLPYTADGASLGSLSARWKDVRAKYLYGNASGTTVSFSMPSDRFNVASGEKLSVTVGKIARWFSDLKALAFKDKVSKSDLDSDVQTSLGKADNALTSPAGGTTGQVLSKTDKGQEWADVPEETVIVKFTGLKDTDSGTLTCDKTYSEIQQLVGSTKQILAKAEREFDEGTGLPDADYILGLSLSGAMDGICFIGGSNYKRLVVYSAGSETWNYVFTRIASIPKTSAILKGNGSGGLVAATPETDYASPVFMRKVTLTVADWNSSTKQQSVTVSGVLADGTKQKVTCSPVDESYDSAWNVCYVQCVDHGADSLTFQCDEIPTAAVEVFVSIQPVSFAS